MDLGFPADLFFFFQRMEMSIPESITRNTDKALRSPIKNKGVTANLPMDYIRSLQPAFARKHHLDTATTAGPEAKMH